MTRTISATEYLWETMRPTVEQILEHPFISGLTDGSLPKEAFIRYLVQDSFYLKDYGRCWAMLGARSIEISDLVTFTSKISWSLESEHPMDKASAHLAKAFPLETDAWRAWSANKRPARLAGRWALVGAEVGKGPVYGSVSINPAGENGDRTAEDFTTEIEYTYARTGETVRRSGRSTVYTGFQWRGRSFVGSDQESAWREVMFVERDWQEMSGRWFHGANDELGVDVTLRRVRNDPVILGVNPAAVQMGGVQAVTIYGANLPAGLDADAIDLGPGLAVRTVTGQTPTELTVEVAVASDAALGGRDVFVAGTNLENGLTVFDQVDRIAVEPRAGMARVGGIVLPKQYQPFPGGERWHQHRLCRHRPGRLWRRSRRTPCDGIRHFGRRRHHLWPGQWIQLRHDPGG